MPKIVDGRKIWFATILTLLIAIIFLSLSNTPKWQGGSWRCARIGDAYYNLEVASNNASRTLGLSKYQTIDTHEGMIFVFDSSDRHAFWMKDTVFPIDIIWLDSRFTVVDHLTMPVENDPANPQHSYTPQSPARYAVELKENEARDVEIGDKIKIVPQDDCEESELERKL